MRNQPRRVSVRIGEACFPSPFASRLEFNAPVHGTWNIVHIGMLVPEAHNIYVCADNCMRGVVMTAAEMGMEDRFSCVTIREQDLEVDNLETITIEGVTEVLKHLDVRPPLVFVFLVCIHLFVGSDESYILKQLRKRFPDISFVRCFMDPIRQKTGPSPDMELRGFMYEGIRELPERPKRVAVLGCDVPFGRDSELLRLIREEGCEAVELQDLESYAEYLALGESSLFLTTYINAHAGIKALAERLGRSFLYLPPVLSYEGIIEAHRTLRNAIRGGGGKPGSDRNAFYARERAACEAALQDLSALIGDTAVAIDYSSHPRPLGMARLLLEAGISVRRVYLDVFSPEEEGDFELLRREFPSLEITATMQAEERLFRGKELEGFREAAGEIREIREIRKTGDPKEPITLAIGQKAAWFEQTPHFVNMIEGGGLWGFEGIRSLCRRIGEAYMTEKDFEEIVPRKGLGCLSRCDLPAKLGW